MKENTVKSVHNISVRILCVFMSVVMLSLFFGISVSAAGSETGIVSFETPVSADDTELKWSNQLGTSYYDAPSTQTVVGDTLLVMSQTTLYKLNAKTGDIIASAEMDETPSYGYTPPAYYDGVIYCPLDNAEIQAFDYKTLKPLWIYRDPLGGQSLTPITCTDGYIYTGFWNDEEEYANYVCLSTQDENESKTDEEKEAVWTYKSLGGFYWAGCAVNGNYVVFGGDDGTSYSNKTSKVVCADRFSGKISDTLEVTGDQRSSVVYDSGRYYFVTKAGYLYSIECSSSGKFNKQTVKKLSLGGASTSSPVIYNGRLYVGVQGQGFSSGYIKVIDAQTLSEIYSVNMKGYPQNSVLVSNAYEQETGKVYIYSTYNCFPGGITVITDSAGQTKPVSEELFTPGDDESGYCLSTICASEDGTLYYKNDSGNIFALGKKNSEENQSSLKKVMEFFIGIFKLIFNWIKNLFS